MTFPEILQEILEYENCTQTDLAKKIKVKPSQISEWLKGKANPGYETLKNIALMLNLSTDYLLGLEDDFDAPTATMEESLTRKERELIEKYRELNAPGKKLIDATMNTLLSASEENKRKGINYDKY